MDRQWVRNRTGVVIVAIICLIIIMQLTSTGRERLSYVEQISRDLFAPVQRMFMRVGHGVSSFFGEFRDWQEFRQVNRQLEAEVERLQRLVFVMAEHSRENLWLRDALDFRERVGQNLVAAEVIARSPTSWMQTIVINRGTLHGIEPGMGVVSNRGVVGSVIEVSFTTATVLLATSSQSAIGSMLQTNGEFLVVEGTVEGSGCLAGSMFRSESTPVKGEVVVASGLSQLFPKGMPIGRVTDVSMSAYGRDIQLSIAPFTDFGRLEYVFVVVPHVEHGDSETEETSW